MSRSVNPYAPPSTSSEPIHNDPTKAIRDRVSRPATALIIMSSIHSTFVAIYLVSALFFIASRGTMANGFFEVAISVVQFVVLLCIAIGAAKLGFLESYRFARLAAVLACIPIVTPFLILGIPFGIWALRLLADPCVRSAFPDVKKG